MTNLSQSQLELISFEAPLNELRRLRDYYDEKFGELFIANKIQLYAEEMAELQTPLEVVISYGGGINISDFIDEGFYERNGLELIDPIKEMFNLLVDELEYEYNARKRIVREYISQSGLKQFTEDIIEGMNKTCGRAILPNENFTFCHPLHIREVEHTNSESLLRFGLNYVDKWKMYNKLFEDTL